MRAAPSEPWWTAPRCPAQCSSWWTEIMSPTITWPTWRKRAGNTTSFGSRTAKRGAFPAWSFPRDLSSTTLWACSISTPKRPGRRFHYGQHRFPHFFVPNLNVHLMVPCVPRRTVAENVGKNAPCPLPEMVSRLGRGAFYVSALLFYRGEQNKASDFRCQQLRIYAAVNKEMELSFLYYF